MAPKTPTSKKTRKKRKAKAPSAPAAPPPPDELPAGPADVWVAFAPRLIELGRTDPADLLTFDVFCRERYRWQQCEAMASDMPIVKVAGVLKAHPALQQAQKAREAWLSAGRELGLVAAKNAPSQTPRPPSPPPGDQPEAENSPQGLKLTKPADEPDGWTQYTAGQGA